jgi:lipoprotein NlpD
VRAVRWRLGILVVVTFAIFFAGCGGYQGLAPVDSYETSARPAGGTHIVKRGETLYAIAWLYGIDYRDLAGHNRIAEPFIIFPGQRLDVVATTNARSLANTGAPTNTRGTASAGPATADRKPTVKSETRSSKLGNAARPVASQPARETTAENKIELASSAQESLKKTAAKEIKQWSWPVKGKVVTSFTKSGRKGVNISGRLGQTVVAAAEGHVVYAGGGLRGYGELIIVKHNKQFLSAYAHNSRILVKEGDNVKIGQRIAEMGDTGTDKVMLHFEIRRDGKPVDPVRYLPK